MTTTSSLPSLTPERPDNDYYYTDAISDQAARFIREHDKATPFFLYVAYTAAHWPMHARERDIAKYKGRYAAGYEAIRKARYEKMLKLGVISAQSTTLWPLPSDLGEKEFWAWDERNMEVFAAMVDSMDQGIGRLVQALKDCGQYENTLICFLQDNGGCAENLGRVGPWHGACRCPHTATAGQGLPATRHDSQADTRRLPHAPRQGGDGRRRRYLHWLR